MEQDEGTRAADHLRRVDPRLGAVIQWVGPRTIPRSASGFPGLARAIIFQQISGAAGEAIWRRVLAAGGRGRLPPAGWFLETPVLTLRAAGLSPQKIGYLKDLAGRLTDGRLRLAPLRHLPDEDVVGALTEVRGIGRWTAQMYLLFRLGRPDILPTGDLGLRKALQNLMALRELPSEGTVDRIGRLWSPFRSYATYYLWRSLEVDAPPRNVNRRRAPSATSRRTANPRARRQISPRGVAAGVRRRRPSRARDSRPTAPRG
ncbi:MAG: DNA-3-methyladenine glycosylase family protein [Thermoplasmata archaeon]